MPRMLLAVGLVLCLPAPVLAGTITETPDPVMGCRATFSGPVEPGDLAQIETMADLFDAYNIEGDRLRLCLDSPGGNFEEGLRIATLLRERYIGTAVAAGARCESACAIAFMGGTLMTESDIGDLPDRVLHPRGRLGFHAPSLVIPQARYSQANVTNAYDSALKTIGDLLAMGDALWFNRSLGVEMVRTPASAMRYIETVGEASRWGIAVAPVIEPKTLSIRSLARACGNIDSFLLDTPQNLPRLRAEDVEINDEPGDWRAESIDGFRQELATGCSINFAREGEARDAVAAAGYAYIGDPWPVWAYQFFNPETPLRLLARKDDSQPELSDQPDVTYLRDIAGLCFAIDGAVITATEDCTLTRTLTRGEDMQVYTHDRYQRADGQQTEITITPVPRGVDKVEMDGQPSTEDELFAATGQEALEAVEAHGEALGIYNGARACFVTPGQQTRFCFLDLDTDGLELYNNTFDALASLGSYRE